ncbi:MAG: ABC transporter substrate-binding protein [Acidobacteriota bacterium]
MRSDAPRRAALALAVLLAACAPTPDPDMLRVLVEKAPSNLDPRYGSDQASSRAQALCQRTLFRIGTDLSPVPDLVARFETPDPLTLVLTLRPARFSDGRPLTSRDVRYTLESIREGTSFRKGDLASIASVEVPDEGTVVLRLAAPDAALLANLVIGILPEGTADANAHPVGAGPYRFLARHGPNVIDFERWEDTPPGAYRRVRFTAVADEMARGLAIRKGDVDLVVNDLPPEIFRSLARDRRFEAHVADGSNYAYLLMNCERPPLSDARVRQAIACAIDRREMIAALLTGLGREATGLLAPESWAYHAPRDPLPFDRDRAARLLDLAGFLDPDGPGGKPRLSLVYKTSSLLASRAQAAVIQDYLGRVGIDVTIQSFEWSTYYEDVKKGNFQLASLVWVGVADPDGLRARFHSGMVPPAGSNRGRYQNDALDPILDEASRTLDRSRRGELYAEAQDILARDAPYVSLWYKSNYALARRGIRGLELGPFADFDVIPELRKPGSAPGAR